MGDIYTLPPIASEGTPFELHVQAAAGIKRASMLIFGMFLATPGDDSLLHDNANLMT